MRSISPSCSTRGRFTVLPGEGSPERACEGDIRLSWLPTPRIEARGQYHFEPGDIEALLNSGPDTKIWHTRLQVRLPDSAEVPSPPTEEAPAWSGERHTGYLGPAEIYPPEIGDGTVLTRVTGLIANGWDGTGSRALRLQLGRRSPSRRRGDGRHAATFS